MPYINLRPDLFGITSLLDFRPATAAPLCSLTQILLRGKSTLSESDRELIAAYVSSLNDCMFCSSAHTTASCLLADVEDSGIIPMQKDLEKMQITDKMKNLLKIATAIQKSGRAVSQEDIDNAKTHGATDMEIHDTVLIAALFCLYNRYVDGLAAVTPVDPVYYEALGQRITSRGYTMPADGYHPLQF